MSKIQARLAMKHADCERQIAAMQSELHALWQHDSYAAKAVTELIADLAAGAWAHLTVEERIVQTAAWLDDRRDQLSLLAVLASAGSKLNAAQRRQLSRDYGPETLRRYEAWIEKREARS